MNKIFNFNRICVVALSMFGISVFAENCLINYTNFDTDVKLCNPDLTNDLDGWYSDSIRNAACTGEKETTIDHVKQGGMIRANIKFSNSITFDSLTKTISNPSGDAIGYLGIVGNPRTLSPYIMDTKSGNMIVTAGFGPNIPFMTYKLSNLKPNSYVTLSFDAYNLYSLDNMEEYLIAINENNDRNLIREISLPGNMVFMMQSMGSTLTAGSGRINGNSPKLSVSTALLLGQADGDRVSTKADYGKSENIQLKTKADKNGEVTFYFKMEPSSSAPIGIDNIQIVGEAQPKINCLKRLPVCPGFPVKFNVENILDSVTYSWKCNSETSNDKTFFAIFDDANKLYKVDCSIEANGCSSTTTSFTVETKECCTSADGTPLAIASLFFDDFGEFSVDNTEYTYTESDGTKHTVSITNGMYTDPTKPFTTVLQQGASVPDFPDSKYDPINSWMIIKENPYTPGIIDDVSGTGRGGMLFLDMNGNDNLNKVIYRRTVNRIAIGTELEYGAFFGAANNNPNGIAELAIYIRDAKTNQTLDSITNIKLNGTEGWIEVEKKIIATCNEITFEIVNSVDNYMTSQGDIVIDNIHMEYCAMPDIAVEPTISSAEALELCQYDSLKLKTLMTESAKNVFNDPMYVFQYTTHDPSNFPFRTNEIWKNINEPSNNPSICLNKDNCILFDAHDTIFYFRVVVGNADDIKEYMNTDAYSLVSISDIHVIAMSKNCPLSDVESFVYNSEKIIKTEYYNFAGQRVNINTKGLIIERQYLENGSVINRKITKE